MVHDHLHKHVPRGINKTSWLYCKKGMGGRDVTWGMDVAECRESLLENYSTLDKTKPERQGQSCTSSDQGAEARSTVSRQLPDPTPGVMPKEAV